MIYFAYGANIDPQQMLLRSRSARNVGLARLDGWRLCFPRYSFIRQSAIASIEEAADDSVWGALYEIADRDMTRLDACEGQYVASDRAGNPFNRIEVEPRYKEGDRVNAFTYVANAMAYAGEPSHDYLSQIARCGRALGFPDDYVERILSLIPGHAEAA
jgi:gamma-glutamylcyclotransferase (GGCT)/AIG2-like uncharacterized protein YtfP